MKKKLDKNPLNIIVKTFLFLILFAYTLSMIFTLAWGLLTSLKSSYDFVNLNNVLGLPSSMWSENELKFGNYITAWNSLPVTASVAFYCGETLIEHYTETAFVGLLMNTILYSVVGAALSSVIPCIVAYLCAKFKYKISGVIYTVVVVTMTIPIIGTQPAVIELLRSLGLYDTFFGYFIQHTGFGGMYFLMYYAFFVGFSDTYIEAAEIDGAGQYSILFRIILPLSIKMIGTVFLIMFVSYWNDYQTALIYMPTHPTLAYAVYWNTVETGGLNDTPSRTAACMMLALPILLIYISFKDKITGNMTLGGIKG